MSVDIKDMTTRGNWEDCEKDFIDSSHLTTQEKGSCPGRIFAPFSFLKQAYLITGHCCLVYLKDRSSGRYYSICTQSTYRKMYRLHFLRSSIFWSFFSIYIELRWVGFRVCKFMMIFVVFADCPKFFPPLLFLIKTGSESNFAKV